VLIYNFLNTSIFKIIRLGGAGLGSC
jgi:hypothetical protein